MRPAAVERMTPALPNITLPMRFDQAPSQRAMVVTLILLVPAAVALLLPFWYLAAGLVTDAAVRSMIWDRPATLAQLLLALGFWVVLLGFPIARMIDGVTRSRSVEISDRDVTVVDRVFGRETLWRGTLGSFDGIAHNVRTSLDGVRHELILVHPERNRCVLIALANRIGDTEISAASDVLGLPRIPADMIQRRTGRAWLAAPARRPAAPAV